MANIDKIKVGIIFGGASREREISFAGGRTIFDNLDKELFEPVILFVDSFRNFIKLDWQYVYKGSIRDFFPADRQGSSENVYVESVFQTDKDPEYIKQIDAVGSLMTVEEVKNSIDFAFLCLHGQSGEDGQIQGLFKFMDIPFSGSGVFASALGMDKSIQKKLIKGFDHNGPKVIDFTREVWSKRKESLLTEVSLEFGFPCVVRPANQGSSIGVRVVKSMEELTEAIEAAFFIRKIESRDWRIKTFLIKKKYCSDLIDIRNDLGYPLFCNKVVCYSPEELFDLLEQLSSKESRIFLEAFQTEHTVMVEEFIDGREFSCIVIRDLNGEVITLPPTEIIKGQEVYDYRSKYMPGLSRKETPMSLPIEEINRIRRKAEGLFQYFGFQVYARIDGFYKENGEIILNDPNTTSGMLPSSFFFHQAAEIGWTPSGFISYIIGQSIKETNGLNLHVSPKILALEEQLQHMISSRMSGKSIKTRVAVILGGYSSERHISVESGRNIFEKLSGTELYAPEPIFLSRKDGELVFHKLPMNLLLKDNADDILNGLNKPSVAWVEELNVELSELVNHYQSDRLVNRAEEISIGEIAENFDFAFIALHGRPGEDGELQKIFEQHNLAYNGSGWESASLTINKFKTLQKLKENGFIVANQLVVQKTDFAIDSSSVLKEIESSFDYPLIAKPIDDGCSSAVKKIDSQKELSYFLQAAFREEKTVSEDLAKQLGLKFKEEFPKKEEILIEQLIEKTDADHFMEITGGLLCSYGEDGTLNYHMFNPSETIAGVDILSLEEKFLAGEGTNITPPRYHGLSKYQAEIGRKVKKKLEEAAKVLKVESYARIDAFVRIYHPDEVEVIIIEVNSLPGMTPATAIFHQAALSELTPYEFVDRIIDFGRMRNSNNK